MSDVQRKSKIEHLKRVMAEYLSDIRNDKNDPFYKLLERRLAQLTNTISEPLVEHVQMQNYEITIESSCGGCAKEIVNGNMSERDMASNLHLELIDKNPSLIDGWKLFIEATCKVHGNEFLLIVPHVSIAVS